MATLMRAVARTGVRSQTRCLSTVAVVRACGANLGPVTSRRCWRTAPAHTAPALGSCTWIPRRCQSTASDSQLEPPDYLTEGELAIFTKIKAELEPTRLEVQDISGGCGSMYALDIASPKFKGLTIIKQHRLVNEVLGEEIKKWHGVQLRTATS